MLPIVLNVVMRLWPQIFLNCFYSICVVFFFFLLMTFIFGVWIIVSLKQKLFNFFWFCYTFIFSFVPIKRVSKNFSNCLSVKISKFLRKKCFSNTFNVVCDRFEYKKHLRSKIMKTASLKKEQNCYCNWFVWKFFVEKQAKSDAEIF